MSADEYKIWVAAFKNALLKLDSKINEGQRKILLGHYGAPDMALSVKRFAEIAGYQGNRAGSLQYGKLARKISEEIGEHTQGDQISTIAEWRGDLKDGRGHGQWILYDEVAQALEELGWVKKDSLGEEALSLNTTKQSFLITWKEGNPPYSFEDFKGIKSWRFSSHKKARVGDKVYLMKQGKSPRGIFGRGVIIKNPYQDDGVWLVDIRIDKIVDPQKTLFLHEDVLFKMSPERGLWYTNFSGVKIPDDVLEGIKNNRCWKLISNQVTAIEPEEVSETTYKAWVDQRIGQQKFRDQLIGHWGGCCAVTGCPLQDVLIASHIVPWKIATPNERLDVYNGLLLTANLDKLFDAFLISFNPKGEILISKSIDAKALSLLGIDANMKLRKIESGHLAYLQRHESKFRIMESRGSK